MIIYWPDFQLKGQQNNIFNLSWCGKKNTLFPWRAEVCSFFNIMYVADLFKYNVVSLRNQLFLNDLYVEWYNCFSVAASGLEFA
jgi:hypothetical protein